VEEKEKEKEERIPRAHTCAWQAAARANNFPPCLIFLMIKCVS